MAVEAGEIGARSLAHRGPRGLAGVGLARHHVEGLVPDAHQRFAEIRIVLEDSRIDDREIHDLARDLGRVEHLLGAAHAEEL